LISRRCPLAESIIRSGAIVISADVGEDEITWILACTHDEFKRLLEKLEDFGCEVIVKSRYSESEDLNQREILLLALKLGYFEFPRKAKLEARSLGISKYTASEILRRALKKVVENFFCDTKPFYLRVVLSVCIDSFASSVER